jgi:hypothetical protein
MCRFHDFNPFIKIKNIGKVFVIISIFQIFKLFSMNFLPGVQGSRMANVDF